MKTQKTSVNKYTQLQDDISKVAQDSVQAEIETGQKEKQTNQMVNQVEQDQVEAGRRILHVIKMKAQTNQDSDLRELGNSQQHSEEMNERSLLFRKYNKIKMPGHTWYNRESHTDLMREVEIQEEMERKNLTGMRVPEGYEVDLNEMKAKYSDFDSESSREMTSYEGTKSRATEVQKSESRSQKLAQDKRSRSGSVSHSILSNSKRVNANQAKGEQELRQEEDSFKESSNDFGTSQDYSSAS